VAIKPIQILINAKDEASSVFDKLRTKVAAVGAAILGYFGIQAFTGAVKGAADLEAALSRVQAATGASADEMAALRKASEDAGANSKFSATEAAGALENLAKAGLTASDAIGTLPAVLQLAQAGDIELATAAEFVTKAINGMGLSFSEAGRVADVLAKGANATNTSVTGLAQALSYAAPLANSLGLSLESTVAIIGKFADAGIDASRAGTALNSIFAQFSDPASKFRTELAATGITTTNFEKALHQLAAAGPQGERAIAAVGQEAGPALRALLNQGVEKLDELTESLKDAAGSAAETAKIMEANLNGSLRGLGSAWDTVKNALATPVLPVLQKGVEQLATSLRSAVSDGTVAKFGQAIASGFQSAITWARNFAASFDVDALLGRLQNFAAEAQQTFDRVGQFAANAGNVVKTAYGVMAGGVNVVLTAIYGIGSVFAETAAVVMSGIAKLRDGLATVTFGELSKSFRAAAQDARDAVEGFSGAAQAMRDKAAESFQAAADAADLAQEGFAGLTESAAASSRAMVETSSVITSVAAGLAAAGEAAAQAGGKAALSADQQAAAAEKASQGIATLRAEYREAINTGNLELAAKKLDELRKATEAAAGAAKDNSRAQKEAAAEIAAAFERAGVQTKQALQQAATTALSDFQKIRDSGMATASGVGEAWKKAADAAISAGDGIAPVWVQAQAALHGYELAVDRAGKATLRLKDAQSDAIQSSQGLAAAISQVTSARERDLEARERALALKDREDALERKRLGVDQAGFSADKNGNRIVAGGDLMTLTGIAAFLKNAGVDDDNTARKIAREFADSNGDVQYMNNPGQKKYGGDTISVALLKAAERYTFGIGGAGPQSPSTIPKPESTRTVRVDLNLNGQSYGSLNTDSAGADMLQQLLSQLGQARSSAAL
jgi:TP901 family phage tail tape measure protein